MNSGRQPYTSLSAYSGHLYRTVVKAEMHLAGLVEAASEDERREAAVKAREAGIPRSKCHQIIRDVFAVEWESRQ
jgi:hypothetical protein